MRCKCNIKEILAEEVARAIKDLFKMVKKSGPTGDLLAVVDNVECDEPDGCGSVYKWGYEHYCDNQECIVEYIKGHKDIFQDLYNLYCKSKHY